MTLRNLIRLHAIIAVNTVARALDWALTKYAPSTPPPDAWHPSQNRPKPREPRPFTDAELDDGHFIFATDQARTHLVRAGLIPLPPSAIHDLRTCEAIGRLGTYEKRSTP